MDVTLDNLTLEPTTASLVLHPVLKTKKQLSGRHPEAQLEEAKGLALAINLDIIGGFVVHLADIRPSTYLGKGKVEELAEYIENADIKLVVMNTAISPIQQRNLEKAWKCKVIDRTALILEIFGERARTNEGKLQVELAALEYQKGRLVRSWTHLERQRGGFGFLGGPGESQIELDRRLITERITKIKRELETVKRTRELHRKSRSAVPYPVVALVGYTNAGKSTLFNTLTGARVVAEDKLFATLDPTMRLVKLPAGNKVILSDTVGFISDLPTELVAAFRATLEEVVEADVILHVRDIASPETDAQKKDVEEVLKKLGVLEELHHHGFEVLNKVDLLPEEQRNYVMEAVNPRQRMVYISALSGEGTMFLLKQIDKELSSHFKEVTVQLDAGDGKLLAWLYEHGEVLERREQDASIYVRVSLSPQNKARLDALRRR